MSDARVPNQGVHVEATGDAQMEWDQSDVPVAPSLRKSRPAPPPPPLKDGAARMAPPSRSSVGHMPPPPRNPPPPPETSYEAMVLGQESTAKLGAMASQLDQEVNLAGDGELWA